MPWIGLGYRCSPQQSTRLSPHFMLFGSRPLIPSKATKMLLTAVDMANQQEAAVMLEERAARLKNAIVITGANIKIA